MTLKYFEFCAFRNLLISERIYNSRYVKIPSKTFTSTWISFDVLTSWNGQSPVYYLIADEGFNLLDRLLMTRTPIANVRAHSDILIASVCALHCIPFMCG